MFDILSKLGEIKEKANQLKTKIDAQSFNSSDGKNLVLVRTNGKKDIIEFQSRSLVS